MCDVTRNYLENVMDFNKRALLISYAEPKIQNQFHPSAKLPEVECAHPPQFSSSSRALLYVQEECPLRLLASAASLLHGQNLYHADEDVDEVELKRNTLVDRVGLHETTLAHPGVVEDFLYIVKGETAEDSKSTVKPDVLGPHECPGCCGWDDEWRKTRKRDDCDTGQKWSTKV